jgi:hypothetical protein
MPADLYTYARLSNDSYTPGKIKAPLAVLYEDRHENFAAKVYAGPSGAIIAYAGTDDARDALVEDAGGIGLLGNTHVLHTSRAIQLARTYLQRHRIVEVCGHSLGGGYAQLVARELDLTCVTFNAPGVSHMSGAGLPGGVFNPVNTTVGDLRNLYGRFVDNNVMYHFRHPQDVVSLIGRHCGTRGCRNLPMPTFSGVSAPASAHGIANIEKWLKTRTGRQPGQF